MAGVDKYWVETLPPFSTADYSGITLTTTAKALWPTGANGPTIINESGFWQVGRIGFGPAEMVTEATVPLERDRFGFGRDQERPESKGGHDRGRLHRYAFE